jgi:hypothetical protein
MSIMERIREVKSLDHFGCWTDRYIMVQGFIMLLSLFGTTTRVNAVKAVILKGETVYLQDCWTGKDRITAERSQHSVKTFNRQLAPGLTHSLLYVPDYLAPEGEYFQKIFYGDSQEQILHKFFYAAQKRYSTPLLPEWSEWLLDQMLPVQEIEFLGFRQAQCLQFLEEENLETCLFEAGSPLIPGDIAVNG